MPRLNADALFTISSSSARTRYEQFSADQITQDIHSPPASNCWASCWAIDVGGGGSGLLFDFDDMIKRFSPYKYHY